MGNSRTGLARLCLSSLLAVSLFAGVSLNATAYGNKGVIRLVTNNETGVAQFSYVDGNNTTTQQFVIAKGTKCIVDDAGYMNWSTSGSMSTGPGALVDVLAQSQADPGPFKGGNSGVGLMNASLGVYNGSNGTSCGRITGELGESLTLTSKVGGFDALDLDIEAKGSAVFALQVDPENNGPVYYLFTGNNAGLAGTKPNSQSCANGSDSGPDSGPNDNCPWHIDAVGTSFKLWVDPDYDTTGVNGEGSLEGGGDYVTAGISGDHSTRIWLTSLIDVGYLGCDPSPADPDNMTAKVYSDSNSEGAASCQVTRINPNNFLDGGSSSPYACTSPIGYQLETFQAQSLCTLDKTGSVREQLASSIKATFPPEPRQAWDGVAKTAIRFTKPDGSLTAPFYAERCGGTVVNDANGNPTIKEVLLGTLPGSTSSGAFQYDSAGSEVLSDANDMVPGNHLIDWACVLDNREVVLSNDLMQVTQTILFWGDIAFSRN